MAVAAVDPAPSARPRQTTARTRFVFVLCPERSGSTLLSAMLGGHSRVLAPAELHLLRYATVGAWRSAYPAAEASLEALLEGTHLDPRSVDDAMPPHTLYCRIQRSAPAGTLLVDKTPAYARAPEALRVADGLRPLYVWLTRHPLGVAASRVNRMWSLRPTENHRWLPWMKYPAWWLRESYRRHTGAAARSFAEDWAVVNEGLASFLNGVDASRVIRVHYEDLVRDPAVHLQDLCKFLGLEPEATMLEPRANAPRGLRWGVGDESLLRHAGVQAGQADAWRREWSEELLSPRVRRVARELGVKLESDLDTAEPGGPSATVLPEASLVQTH